MSTLRRQQGIGIPAAIFVITLLAVISVAISSLVTDNAETIQEEVLLTRAFYAAESGAGFGMSALFPPEEFPSYDRPPGGEAQCDPGPREYTLEADGLNACEISLTCGIDATVAGVEYYTITSTATCFDVTRTVQVRTSFEP